MLLEQAGEIDLKGLRQSFGSHDSQPGAVDAFDLLVMPVGNACFFGQLFLGESPCQAEVPQIAAKRV